MRADRLTRKTHLRKLSHRDLQREVPSARVIDLTRDMQGVDDSDLRCVIALADLMRGGAEDAPESAFPPAPFHSEHDALAWCVRMMAQSPTARRLCALAGEAGWSVGLADMKNEGFYIDAEDRLILLDHFALAPAALGRSAYFRHVLLTTFIRALRDVWHEDKTGDITRDFGPEQILMLARIRAADCDAVTILCGWELRAAGLGDVWRHVLGSDEGDMAIVFSRFLERDPGSLFNGAALAHAFRQWYADTARVDAIDHDTLEALDDILDTADQPNPFGQARLSAAAIEDMAVLPDGIAYLAGLGDRILRDPFFAGLHDMINQTHLFQMIYDTETIMVNNVPFRDAKLARLIFPQADAVRIR